jgi:hypothetical protein
MDIYFKHYASVSQLCATAHWCVEKSPQMFCGKLKEGRKEEKKLNENRRGKF